MEPIQRTRQESKVCHIGVFAKAQFDILEFFHDRQNIVQNVQISIQVDGPTYVLRR